MAAIECQGLLFHHHGVQFFLDLKVGLRKILLSLIVVQFHEQLFLEESLTNGSKVKSLRTDDALV